MYGRKRGYKSELQPTPYMKPNHPISVVPTAVLQAVVYHYVLQKLIHCIYKHTVINTDILFKCNMLPKWIIAEVVYKNGSLNVVGWLTMKMVNVNACNHWTLIYYFWLHASDVILWHNAFLCFWSKFFLPLIVPQNLLNMANFKIVL